MALSVRQLTEALEGFNLHVEKKYKRYSPLRGGPWVGWVQNPITQGWRYCSAREMHQVLENLYEFVRQNTLH